MTARSALAFGLVLVAAIATWWLGSVAIALSSASAVAPLARNLLAALVTVRALAIAVVGVESGRATGWLEASGALALVAAAGWPLVLVGQWSSEVSPWPVLAAEAGLLGLAATMAALGGAMGRAVGRAPGNAVQMLRPAAYATGVLVAAALWWQRSLWLAWLSA